MPQSSSSQGSATILSHRQGVLTNYSVIVCSYLYYLAASATMDFEAQDATARTPSRATSLAHRADQLSLQRMGGARQRAEDAEAHDGKQVASLPFPHLGAWAGPGMRALPLAFPRVSTPADPPPACSVQTHNIYKMLETQTWCLEGKLSFPRACCAFSNDLSFGRIHKHAAQ